MIEIIERCEGKISGKQRLDRGKAQISFNSDNHLVIRIIPEDGYGMDTLVVLDAHVSGKVIEFCQDKLVNERLRNRFIQNSNIPF